MKVLVAVGAHAERLVLQADLSQMKHEVIAASSGLEAIELFERERPDLVLLDVTLSDMDGYAVIRRIRAISIEQWIPVILLGSLAREEDIAKGINAGADDYLIKPIRPILLRAKLQAMQRIIKWHHRRAGIALIPSVSHETAPPVLRRGDLTLDLEAHRVALKGQDISVSPREWTILTFLMRNMGKLVLRVALEQMLYGEYGEVESNAIDVHIHHLRRKLGRNLIRTVRGVGFMIEYP